MLERDSSEEQEISQDEIPTVISPPAVPPSEAEDASDSMSETLAQTVIPQGTVSPRAKRKSKLGTIPVIRPKPVVVTDSTPEEVDMGATIVETPIPRSPALPMSADVQDLGQTMSPFDDDDDDEDDDGDVLTKTSTSRRLDSADLDSMNPEVTPEVLTRTLADASAIGIEDLDTEPSAQLSTPPEPVATPVPISEEPLSSVSTLDPSMVYMPGEYALPQAQAGDPRSGVQGAAGAAVQAVQAVLSPPPDDYPQAQAGDPRSGVQAVQAVQGAAVQGAAVLSPPPDDYPSVEYPRAQSPHDNSYPDAALDALEKDGPADRANPVWRQAHPSAQRWAKKRNAAAPRSPRAGVIALGLVLAGFGSYLLALFLPSKAPLTAAISAIAAEQAGVDIGAWRFKEDLFNLANLNAALLVVLGIVVVLRGALHRQSAQHNKKSKMSIFLVCCAVILVLSFVGLALFASV